MYIIMNIFDKSECKKHLFEASKVVDEPLRHLFNILDLVALIG